jgi:basic membrane protein A
MARSSFVRLSLLMVALLLFAACSSTPGASTSAAADDRCAGVGTAGGEGELQIPDAEEGQFNVAMVLIGPHDDGGWSQAHYEGLQYVCENVEGSHVAYIENVPEGADSEQVFRSLSRKGFDFIIGTSFGYMDPMAAVAEEFPDITYLHLTGFKSNGTNFGNFFGAMEDFKYLAGMVAGSRAKADGNPKVGYMATFPIPEEIRLGNAIMLGVKKTCPECTMDVRFINTWHDPIKEKDAAASLFDAGAQVVFTGADTGAVADVAQEKGKWGVTYDHPASCKVERCLTAPYWIWGPEYARIAESVKAGTYEAGYEYFDADSKAMGLLGFMEGETPLKGMEDLPEADIQLVRDTLAKFLAGDMNRFDVFAGPITDNTGKEVLAAGEKLEQSDLDQFPPGAPGNECETCMYWWADGITVELPALE